MSCGDFGIHTGTNLFDISKAVSVNFKKVEIKIQDQDHSHIDLQWNKVPGRSVRVNKTLKFEEFFWVKRVQRRKPGVANGFEANDMFDSGKFFYTVQK